MVFPNESLSYESADAYTGDYVSIYDDGILVASGVVLEIYDIPNTFGRKMYIISVNGRRETYDNGFCSLKILSSVSEKVDK